MLNIGTNNKHRKGSSLRISGQEDGKLFFGGTGKFALSDRVMIGEGDGSGQAEGEAASFLDAKAARTCIGFRVGESGLAARRARLECSPGKQAGGLNHQRPAIDGDCAQGEAHVSRIGAKAGTIRGAFGRLDAPADRSATFDERISVNGKGSGDRSREWVARTNS